MVPGSTSTQSNQPQAKHVQKVTCNQKNLYYNGKKKKQRSYRCKSNMVKEALIDS